jgi:acyl-CoA synthetase (AMP-forming)/AMP-acid ligase II
MIIRGDHNVYPGLYEPSIASIAGVRRCSLIGVYSDSEADERIVLVVEPESGQDLSRLERRIRSAIQHGPHQIDRDAHPDAILFARLPLAGRSNKVDKRALLELVQERVGAC